MDYPRVCIRGGLRSGTERHREVALDCETRRSPAGTVNNTRTFGGSMPGGFGYSLLVGEFIHLTNPGLARVREPGASECQDASPPAQDGCAAGALTTTAAPEDSIPAPSPDCRDYPNARADR
jgi:hypothetical protein